MTTQSFKAKTMKTGSGGSGSGLGLGGHGGSIGSGNRNVESQTYEADEIVTGDGGSGGLRGGSVGDIGSKNTGPKEGKCIIIAHRFDGIWDHFMHIWSYKTRRKGSQVFDPLSLGLQVVNDFPVNYSHLHHKQMPFSLFKSRHTRSLVSQSSTKGTPGPTIPAVVQRSENASNVIGETGDAVVTSSDTASPARSAAINALKFSLQHLGKVPLPGIEAATNALLDIINRIQNMSTVEKACKRLTKRIESLWYLVSSIREINEGGRLVEPLIDELKALTNDLETASRQNNLVAFFNNDDDICSMESHDQFLSGIVTDLTATLATATHKDTSQIRIDINEAVKLLHADGNYTPGGSVTRMSKNRIQRVEGKFDADNKVSGTDARMLREIHGNEIGFIGGDAFSGNVVSSFPP